MIRGVLAVLSASWFSLSFAGCNSKQSAVDAPRAEVAEPAKEQVKAAPVAPEAKTTAATPAAGDEGKRAAELVGGLGSPDYPTREKAAGELAAMGRKALPELEKAAGSSDAEVAARAKGLVERIKWQEEEAHAPEVPGLAEMLKGVRASGHGPGGGLQLRVQGGPGVVVGPTVRTGGDTRTVSNDQGSVSTGENSDGAVSLTIKPKDGEAKSYSAVSREEFKKRYPKLYAKYLEN
jgi:hypothetical protein